MEVKPVKFKLSSWRKLRRSFYGRKNETFSEYIERVAEFVKENKLQGLEITKGEVGIGETKWN